ncbi:Leucine-rich repeat-containing protein 4B [Melipona quadrifasciata]|uniref:Leucine-rich repeat-containing protein 4B n=1 Tax=Melipona quadrifasciata TaxID=166423 RepID=A0A0N0U4Y3_9HYME|nr:Leucine-rich repeat-containing protein 4B [Melipona quadrifasciata]
MWLGTITILVLIATTNSKLVDLSERGLKKEDFFMKIQTQFNLQEVTDLILQKNEFDSFLDCSTNLVNLRTLDLSQNHLQRFFFLCKDEYNLQVLNVSHNKLEYIDNNALNNRIPKLKILDLSWNRLSIVNETMLEHFKVLEYLTLANNPINNGIHENAFWNLKVLRYLNLSNVSSSYFSSEFFKTLTNLSTLDLSENPISVIPLLPANLEELDLSNTHVSRLRGIYLPGLRELRLNGMKNLTELLLNDFENLTSLETLSLDGSKALTFFKLSPFNDHILPRLRRLSVRNCGLRTLSHSLVSIIKRTPILNLEDNPWHCDCKMQWLSVSNATKLVSQQIKHKERNEEFALAELRNVSDATAARKSAEASLPGGSIGRKARRDRRPRLDYTDPCSMGTLWNSFLDIPERDGLTGPDRTRMLRVLRGDIECP